MSETLAEIAKEKGFKTLSELATAMGRKPSTFFNNLAYFERKPNFDSKFSLALQKALGVDENILRQAIKEKAYAPIHVYMEDREREEDVFKRLLNTAEPGEIIYYASNDRIPPYHLGHIRPLVFRAMLKGIRFFNVYEENNPKIVKEAIIERQKTNISFFNSEVADSLGYKQDFHSLKDIQEFVDYYMDFGFGDLGSFALLHSYFIINMDDDKVFEDNLNDRYYYEAWRLNESHGLKAIAALRNQVLEAAKTFEEKVLTKNANIVNDRLTSWLL